MSKHHKKTGPSPDPVTKMAADLAEVTAERARVNQDLLIALANALAAIEETQRRFRSAVCVRLSRIETTLTDVQGAQLVQLWPPEKVSKEQRAKYLQEVQERVSRGSREMGLSMVRFIYDDSVHAQEPRVTRDRRRKWSGWEI